MSPTCDTLRHAWGCALAPFAGQSPSALPLSLPQVSAAAAAQARADGLGAKIDDLEGRLAGALDDARDQRVRAYTAEAALTSEGVAAREREAALEGERCGRARPLHGCGLACCPCTRCCHPTSQAGP